MVEVSENTLIILPHLDDEIFMTPLIKSITKRHSKSLTLVFCAERIFSSKEYVNKRREESLKSLSLLGCLPENIIYLNDHFEVNDLEIVESAKNIYNFLNKLSLDNKYKQILTLNLEGGHPDHDALSLIVYKYGKENNLETFFVPAYNYQRSAFLPVSVFIPLKSHKKYFSRKLFNYFSWADSLKIAFIYKSERKAFVKLLPFIIFKAFFSRDLYMSQFIDENTVDWEKSLTFQRYKIDQKDILKKVNSL